MPQADAGNIRGRRTRERLLSAGWALLDEIPLSRLFELLPSGAITDRAGYTTGALRHHFPTAADFVRGMQQQPIPSGFFGAEPYGPARKTVIDGLIDLTADGVTATIRAAGGAPLDRTLQRGRTAGVPAREQLLRSRIETDPDLADLLRGEIYDGLMPTFVAAYETAFAAPGASSPRGTVHRGLHQHLGRRVGGLCWPTPWSTATWTTNWPVNAYLAVAYGLTAATDHGARSIADLEAEAAAGTPLTQAGRLQLDVAARAHAAVAAQPDSRELSWSDLAAAAELDPVELRRLFPDRSSVLALGFAVHLPDIETAVGRHVEVEPRRALADGVCELVRRARSDPRCAQALLNARMDLTPAPIRALVPLAGALARCLDDHDTHAAERVVDSTLALALTHRGASPAEVASWSVFGTTSTKVSSPSE